MRIYLLIISFIIIFLLNALSARAFDGNRNGLVLGGSIGGGMMRYDRDIKDSDTKDKNTEYLKVFALDIIIGYGISNKFIIYYNNKELWTFAKRTSGEKTVYVNSMGPLGVSYYLKNESPSFFLNIGVGFAHFYAPIKNGQELDYGFGICAGLGYEFTDHYGINLTYVLTRTNMVDNNIKIHTDSHSIVLTFSAFYY